MARGPVATGFVDLGATGATELRIHGVGGTSPQELLDHPHPVQVAGDATSGFYRRWDTDEPAATDHHVEGFSWGGMTSGSSRRALWLLLVPFLLVNVGHWALPGRAAQRRWANTAAQRVLRLLALSLTMTLALAAAETGIDLLGRQCAGTTCFKSAPSWMSSLAAHRAVLVCMGALVPLGVIVLLGVLGRSTWKTTERVDPKTGPGRPADPADPAGPAMADPLFWAGAEPVRRLRAVHLSAALAVAAAIQVLPVMDGPRRPFAVAVLVASGLVVGVSAALAIGDGVARPHHRRLLGQDLSQRAHLLVWVTGAVFALSLIVDLLPKAVPAATGAAPHDLRRLDGLVQLLFGAQTAMVVLLAVFALAAGLQPDAVQAGRRRPSDKLIAPALAVLAWLLAWFFTSGLTVRMAQQLFGNARGAVPGTYIVFAALIAPGGGLILIGIAIAAVRWYRAEVARQHSVVTALASPAGPGAGDTPDAISGRTAAIASVRARAGLLDIVPQLVVAATVACVAFATVGLVLAISSRRLTDRPGVQQLADLGTLLLGLGILRFLLLARTAWKQGSTRRTLGILWDLGTFWPRAAHPLAPPCYCERALPQLHTRLTHVGGRPDDHVVVAGHSQGSVISAALVLMTRSEDVPARISLLTYGCPLGRLYARAFPGYLGPQVLGAGGPAEATGRDPAALTVRSRSWQWLNLYRGTDPIGGYVDVPADGTGPSGVPFGASGATRTTVDVVLVDPDFAVAPGDIFASGAAGHSHYREDATYDAAIDELLSMTSVAPADTTTPTDTDRKAGQT